MASEDSQFLNVAMISSSLRRRLPPRFIGPLNERTCSMPETERCRPDRTSSVIVRKTARSCRFGLRNMKSIEEREDPLLQINRPGDFEVEDTVTAPSNRSRTEDRTKKLWNSCTDLRDVERQPMEVHGHALDGWGR